MPWALEDTAMQLITPIPSCFYWGRLPEIARHLMYSIGSEDSPSGMETPFVFTERCWTDCWSGCHCSGRLSPGWVTFLFPWQHKSCFPVVGAFGVKPCMLWQCQLGTWRGSPDTACPGSSPHGDNGSLLLLPVPTGTRGVASILSKGKDITVRRDELQCLLSDSGQRGQATVPPLQCTTTVLWFQ